MRNKYPCPLEWGDRIDHKIFGLGVINGEPIPSCCGDARTGEVLFGGYAISVKWDDESRGSFSVMDRSLSKISPVEAKGFAYWERQWKSLLEDWILARKGVEDAIRSSFGPKNNIDISRIQAEEVSALQAILRFLEDDRNGLHP